MQANKDQNWTDDGAFWDEAWTDMNRRLDENPPNRKRRVVWWWYAGALLALLLVVTPTVVAHVFEDGIGTETEGKRTPPPSAPLKAPAPHPAAAPEKAVYAANAVSDARSEVPKTEETKAPTTPPASLEKPGSASENPPKYGAPKADETSTAPPTNEAFEAPKKRVTLPAPSPVQSPGEEIAARFVPSAISALARAEFTALPVPNITELPVIVAGKGRHANALTLEAGALGTSRLTGFYAGAGYRFKLSGRWSVPVALRYRKEEVLLSAFPVPNENNDLAFNPNTSATNDQDSVIVSSVNGDIAVDLSSGVLLTEAVETRVGLQYALTPRLRVGAGISAAYLWRADLSFRATTIDASSDLGNPFSLLRSGTNSLNYNFGGASFDVSEGQLPDIDPLHLRAYLDLNFDLTPRLGLTAGGSILLRQPDRNETIGVPAGRASVGLRWRLR
jgi:hypothetical protein